MRVQSLSSKPRQPDNADKLRRILVSITQEQWERLGIAAIKKQISRNEIVREALNDYVRKLSAEFRPRCACMQACPNAETSTKRA
jgi:metal-responsive CopG/Arc/MetJ family transcriptional regulator